MTSSKTAASGRFDVHRLPEPGAGSWVHRWLGKDFVHLRGDNVASCLCKPYFISPDDKRTLDEIADDLEEEEVAKN